MLEIIFIYQLSKRIGQICGDKGYSKVLAVISNVLAWIIMEVIGFVVGILIFGEGIAMYVIALGFAALSQVFTRIIANRLPDKNINNEKELIDNSLN